MATLEEIAAALQKADAAGNVEDARALAGAYRQAQAQQGQAAAPAKEPEWRAPGTLVPIQFNTDGGARLAVPQLATDAWNAFQAPGKALKGEYDQLEVNPQTGAVAPFDTRMMDDATNLASMVSPVTPAARSSMTALKAAAPKRAPMPTIDDLYARKAEAYGVVDKLGARYSQPAVESLAADMIKKAAADNISPERHPKAYSMLVDLQANPQSMTLTQLDQMRQVIRRDLVNRGDDAEAHFGGVFIDAIDNFIENASDNAITGATGQTANFAIKTARQQNTILRKSETLEKALDNARLRAAASGSGGNVDNTMRQELVRIVKSDKLSRGFTADEIAGMRNIINGGGKVQDLLRLIGKLSPSGNGLMAALGLGATATNPLLAAGPAAGMIAKTLADRATKTGFDNLTEAVRAGGSAPVPLPRGSSPLVPKANTTLLEQNLGPGMRPQIPAKFRLDA